MDAPDSPSAGRRPLTSRQLPVFQWLAARLARTRITPNAISMASIVFGALAGAAMAATAEVDDGPLRRLLWLLGAVFIQLRLLANMLDGMVAVEGGKRSPVGDLYNEVPDRLSDAATLIGAGLAVGGRLDLGFAAALLAVLVAYVRALGASLGAGQIFLGPFAKPHRMALMTATCLACAVLPAAWQTVHGATGIGIVGAALAVISLGCVLTTWRRLRRIADWLHHHRPTGA